MQIRIDNLNIKIKGVTQETVRNNINNLKGALLACLKQSPLSAFKARGGKHLAIGQIDLGGVSINEGNTGRDWYTLAARQLTDRLGRLL